MFFRRQKIVAPTFSESLEKLKKFGFRVESSGGKARVGRSGIAADVADGRDVANPVVSKAGVLVGGDIGLLVDLGYQKVFQTPNGRRVPATAAHLTALHAFEEDLREGLGLKSLYNQSLGTENDLHLYDRVAGRDAQRHPKPWDR
jgi:hypothetical protein